MLPIRCGVAAATSAAPRAVIYIRVDPDDVCLSMYRNAKVSLTTYPPTITVRSRLRHTSYYSDAGGVCQASSLTATTLESIAFVNTRRLPHLGIVPPSLVRFKLQRARLLEHAMPLRTQHPPPPPKKAAAVWRMETNPPIGGETEVLLQPTVNSH